MSAPILIVGAGPTGLALALRLHRHGAAFRIIDQAEGPGTQSRALVVHARTLEFYQQLGLADRLVAAGTKVQAIRLRERGADIAHLSLGNFGKGLSPFPFALCLPQDEHETLLTEALAASGVEVEWGVKLERLEQAGDQVTVRLRGQGEEEAAAFAYVAGCDGARSVVRHALGVGFGGGEYDRLYYVADVTLSGGDRDFVGALDPDDFALRMPSRQGRNERLIGYVPRGAEANPTFDAVRPTAERLLGIKVGEVNWFSTYRVHHRVAEHFRIGRAFLLGDAGHLHSPAGGQGMNTGIGDAVNLSWKLAAVARGRAAPALLDSYEPERIAFARALVSTTDRAFRAISDAGAVGRLVRAWAPRVLPSVTRVESARRVMFRTLSQIQVQYRASALSRGAAGTVAGGERLPWVESLDNFAPLAAMDWQVHVFGDPPAGFAEAALALGLPVHRFDHTEAARRAGFGPRAAYLIRPDGHVGLAMPRPSADALAAYADRHGLSFGGGLSDNPGV